jgi:hypothetical protein
VRNRNTGQRSRDDLLRHVVDGFSGRRGPSRPYSTPRATGNVVLMAWRPFWAAAKPRVGAVLHLVRVHERAVCIYLGCHGAVTRKIACSTMKVRQSNHRGRWGAALNPRPNGVSNSCGRHGPRHARHVMTRQNFLNSAQNRTVPRPPAGAPGGGDSPLGRRKPLICRHFRKKSRADGGFPALRGRCGAASRPSYTLGFWGPNQGVAFAFVRLRGYGRARWLVREV